MRAKSIHWRTAVRLAALIACAGVARGQTTPPAAIPVAPEANPQPSVNYRMLPKDSVHIKVFQEDDLETTARIDNDGNIFFPLLGKAKIGGETVQEATATMEKLLKVYLINPEVSVEITSYAKQHFTVLGQVNKPSIFDIPDEGSLNLLEALGMAGGFSKIANPSKIMIKRVVNGQEIVIRVDGKKMLDPKNTTEPIPQILPGDTISVGEAIF
jgi:protein involved in polysaccharide export with SLBB domain